MKRLLIALLLIAAALFIGLRILNAALASLIEAEAGRILQTSVEIDKAELHPFPAALTLHGLQIGDAQNPRRNLLTADSLRADIDPEALFSGRLVAQRVSLRGLRLQQPRAGADAAATEAAAATPPLPDPARLAAESALRLRGELQQIAQALTAIDQRWQPRRPRIAAADARQLQDWEGELRQDLAQVQQLLGRARALPDAELARQLAAFGIDSQRGNITQALLAPALAPLLAELARLQAPAGAAGGWPLLIRRLELAGELSAGTSAIPFSGELRNVTPQPALWNLPLQIDLTGGDGGGHFTLQGQWGAGGGDLRLRIEQLPLSDLPFTRSPLPTVLIGHAIVTGDGRLRLDGGRLDGSAQARLQQVALQVSADGSGLSRRAAQALSGIDAFDLQLRLTGSPQAPEIDLQSSLDQQLQPLLGQALQEGAASLRGELERQLAPERQRLEALTGNFNALQRQLAQRRDALQGGSR